MRFDDWDVLLLTQDTKIPIQEFRTEAWRVDDFRSPPPRSAYDNVNSSELPDAANHEPTKSPTTGQLVFRKSNPAKTPLLTTNVPSLPEGTNFMVSVHSWTEPCHDVDPAVLQDPQEVPVFQVRVMIDGAHVSSQAVRKDYSWPMNLSANYHLISPHPVPCKGNESETSDSTPDATPLAWPPFHQNQITNRFWYPEDDWGRIKVIVSRGILNLETGEFSNYKNLVVFAFQHAPMTILGQKNLAWSTNYTPKYKVVPYVPPGGQQAEEAIVMEKDEVMVDDENSGPLSIMTDLTTAKDLIPELDWDMMPELVDFDLNLVSPQSIAQDTTSPLLSQPFLAQSPLDQVESPFSPDLLDASTMMMMVVGSGETHLTASELQDDDFGFIFSPDAASSHGSVVTTCPVPLDKGRESIKPNLPFLKMEDDQTHSSTTEAKAMQPKRKTIRVTRSTSSAATATKSPAKVKKPRKTPIKKKVVAKKARAAREVLDTRSSA